MKKEQYDHAISIIRRLLRAHLPLNVTHPLIESYISFNDQLISDSYMLIPWPDSQDYMEKEWFRDEAILAEHESVGSSAYFIPTKYLLQT